MKKVIKYLPLVIALFLIPPGIAKAQECGNCKQTPIVACYDLDIQIPPPETGNKESEGWLEWRQLFWFGKHAHGQLFQQNKNCIHFTQPLSAEVSVEAPASRDGIELTPLVDEQQILKVGQTYTNLPPSGDVSRFGDYIISGFVKQSGNGYIMHIELQTACSRKTVAFSEVPFIKSASSDYTMSIAAQAVAQLSPLADKIKKFEIEERQKDNKIAFASMEMDEIEIKPKKRNLGVGEQTELEITMRDCDGFPLANRQINFTKGSIEGMSIPGTTGGTLTPEKIITDASGKAKVMFRMGSSKSAMVNAHYLHNKPIGCAYAKLGSVPIGSIPVKVSVQFFQNETATLKRATLPGVDVEGGTEMEQTNMSHTSIIYHYPSAAALEEGMLVEETPDKSNKDSKTEHFMETGHFNYTKKVEDATIFVLMGDKRVPAEVEKGSVNSYSGTADIQHPSQILFFKGDAHNPPSFAWNVEYPASNGEDIAFGGIAISKEDEGVKWQVNKISDPDSPYKTEYIIEQTLDAAEELKKGNKAMKDFFGFDIDGLTKSIDPTKPKDNMAAASGNRTVIIRILSPYPEK